LTGLEKRFTCGPPGRCLFFIVSLVEVLKMPLPTTPPRGPVTLSQNARTVLAKRYLVKDDKGQPVESPEDLFWRVATVVAEADRVYGASEGAVNGMAEEFYGLMTQRRFEPNSPTL